MGEPVGDELSRLWTLVDHLGYDLDPSILIGGWATQLRVGGEISRDIDLIIASPELRSRLREVLDDYSENTLHSGGRKARGTIDGIHVDAYIPHESLLGNRLRLNVVALARHTDSGVVRGWHLLTVDAHLATKFAALLDRPDTEKGAKDAREVVALLHTGATPHLTISVILEATEREPREVPELVREAFDLAMDRSGVNKGARRDLAQQRRIWVDEVERQVRRLDRAE